MQRMSTGRPQREDVPDQNVVVGPWTLEQRQIAALRLFDHLLKDVQPGGRTHALLKSIKKSPA